MRRATRRLRAHLSAGLGLFFCILPHGAAAGAAPKDPPKMPPNLTGAGATELARQGGRLLREKDYLGFRVFLKKAYSRRISYREWLELRGLVNSNPAKVGFDLINVWNARNLSARSSLDRTLEAGDRLMLAGQFDAAFESFQKVANYLKRTRAYYNGSKHKAWNAAKIKEIDAIYPYVLQSIGRALYGAGRFDEALTVYKWIEPTFPRFRQVLFERMWAAFRSGRVEIALGAIASQRSAYFAPYLSPESYLIQLYIYRRLCRKVDLEQVTTEMKKYQDQLTKGSLAAWVGSDLEARLLMNLSEAEVRDSDLGIITLADKQREKAEIKAALQRAFTKSRPKLLGDLKIAIAYGELAKDIDTSMTLKPISKLTSRDALSRTNQEIWPADSAEDWVDEIGSHVFVGDSLCSNAAH